MKKELDNFIIESDIELDYFDTIIKHITNNEKRLFDFFNIDKLPNKVKIYIMSYKSFKEFIISKYGEILDYIIGDSDSRSNTIRILNIDDQIKYTIHKNANIEELKGSILHEIVHQCQGVYNKDYRETTWFSEGLATNLSGQHYKLENLNNCDFNKLKTDFKHYKGSYRYSYTIVNYILNNYTKDEIEKLYKNSDYIRSKADEIFEEAKKTNIS